MQSIEVAHRIVVDAPKIIQWCVGIEIDGQVLCFQKSRLFDASRDAVVSIERVFNGLCLVLIGVAIDLCIIGF